MARGVTPRQPARSGRQEGTRVVRGRAAQTPSRTRHDRKLVAPKPSKKAAGKAKAVRSKASTVKGYNPIAPAHVQAILKHLDALYPEAVCALHHKTAWELLVATILSAQSTDANVNRVTPGLFSKYPTVQAFAALNPEQLEPDVRSTGFFRNKSRSVVGAANKIVSDFDGEVPQEMDQLLTLPGVARKTANVVLGSWFKKAIGVVVDTHVH